MLLIVFIVCGILTAYQTINSKKDAVNSKPIEAVSQSNLQNSDIYIKQTTAPATPRNTVATHRIPRIL